jgi:N-acetylglutamate synthase/N-acetylornithine aminotransferase
MIVNEEHVPQLETKSTFLITVGFTDNAQRAAKNQGRSLNVHSTSSKQSWKVSGITYGSSMVQPATAKVTCWYVTDTAHRQHL